MHLMKRHFSKMQNINIVLEIIQSVAQVRREHRSTALHTSRPRLLARKSQQETGAMHVLDVLRCREARRDNS